MNDMGNFFRKGHHAHEKSISAVDIFTVVGIVAVLVLAVYAAMLPERRLADLRNAKRLADVNAISNVFVVQQERDGLRFNGDPSAPVDDDPRTAQVIADSASGVTCALGLPTTPSCPGAAMSGLVVPATDGGCVAVIGQDAFARYGDNDVATVPIDPFGIGHDPEPFIVDSVLGVRNSGYYVNRTASGRIEIGACHPENGASIRILR
jgi:hypothetical protein